MVFQLSAACDLLNLKKKIYIQGPETTAIFAIVQRNSNTI